MRGTRPAVPEDAGAIARVQVSAWRAAYVGIVPQATLDALSVPERTARWERILSTASRCWVFEADAVVGFACVDPAAGELGALYVLPAWWGHGAGPALHDLAVDGLRAAGCAEPALWVMAPNVRARAFYERRGWRLDGRGRETSYGGTTVRSAGYRRGP